MVFSSRVILQSNNRPSLDLSFTPLTFATMVAISPFQLSADAVTPTSNNNYVIQNLGTGHVLDDASALFTDGNPILSDARISGNTSQAVSHYIT